MKTIRVFRKRLGLTQSQLAEKIGCSLDTVSRYETDKREPGASVLLRLCEALNCSADELICGVKDLLAEDDSRESRDKRQNRLKLDFTIQNKGGTDADGSSDDVLSEMRVQIVFTDGKAHVEFCGASREDASEADIFALFDKAKAAAIAALRSAGVEAQK